MIGYKACKAGGIRVIVTLEIPADAITNIARPSVVVPETAEYRTNKAKVLKIEDEAGNTYTSAKSFGYDRKIQKYVLNETVQTAVIGKQAFCTPYDLPYLSRRCAIEYGMLYFLSRRCATLYEYNSIQDGLYQRWYPNGNNKVTCTYVNGKRHGAFQTWYKSGEKERECNYMNGTLHGLYQRFNKNGQLLVTYNYVNGRAQFVA